MFHSFTPYVEISIIAIMMNYLLSFFWNTRSSDLIFGVVAFLFILVASSWFNLPILHQILVLVSNVALIALIIIFQPELRAALSRLSVKGTRTSQPWREFDRFLDQLTKSVYRFSERHIGALIVLENRDVLNEFIQRSTHLNAVFSSELLETIFMNSSPLHDGAVIIRNTTVLAARVILPLAEESFTHMRSVGTRHHAALGLSETTDSVIVVVSEENGKVSIARGGTLTRGVKTDRFQGILRSIFSPQQHPPKKRGFWWPKFHWRGWK